MVKDPVITLEMLQKHTRPSLTSRLPRMPSPNDGGGLGKKPSVPAVKNPDAAFVRERPIAERKPNIAFENAKQEGRQMSLLSNEAKKLFIDGKIPIITSVDCPHCANEKKIIEEGKYRTFKLKKKPFFLGGGYKLEYTEWTDPHKSLKVNQNSLGEIESLYRKKKISEGDYQKYKRAADHIVRTNQIILDPSVNFQKVRGAFQFIDANRFSDSIIRKAEAIYDHVHVDKGVPIEVIYESLKKSKDPDASSIFEQLKVTEVDRVYGIMSYPTFLNPKCPKSARDPIKNARDKVKYLSECKSPSFLETMGVIDYYIQQTGDDVMANVVSKVSENIGKKKHESGRDAKKQKGLEKDAYTTNEIEKENPSRIPYDEVYDVDGEISDLIRKNEKQF